MGASSIIFESCTKLPILKRYIADIKPNTADNEKNIQHTAESIGVKFS